MTALLESHKRRLNAIDALWMYTGELFSVTSYELRVVSEGVAFDPTKIEVQWEKRVKEVFNEATLTYPR